MQISPARLLRDGMRVGEQPVNIGIVGAIFRAIRSRKDGPATSVALRGQEIAALVECLYSRDIADIPGMNADKTAAALAIMAAAVHRGCAGRGQLPGPLHLQRRAPALHQSLCARPEEALRDPLSMLDWVNLYAMAVNEENAAGGQVVTAPTNGAAGVVPAVIRYWLEHVPGASERQLDDFLLTASAVGGLIKHNASISGAECGCQAEVGSASAMAAAGLCAVLGGTPQQVENAAEIALEHHLGMTCDPVAGLVQVPCIERNGLGAIKAVSAASLALRGDGQHFVPLDAAIETMRQTGADMSEKYKETSLGGLAVNVPNC